MSQSKPRMELELTGDIKVAYASQIEKSTKALENFQKKLECLSLQHKKVLEKNIKLYAENQDLKEQVKRLSERLEKNLQSAVYNNDLPTDCNDNDDNTPNNNISTKKQIESVDEVIGPSPEQQHSKSTSKLRLKFKDTRVSRKLSFEKTAHESLKKS